MSGSQARTGLLSRLAGLIRREEKKAQAAPPPPKAESGDLTADDFRLVIKNMLDDEEQRFHTRLQIISLVEFRDAVGDKWAQVRDKVMMIAEGVIQLHIGPGNLFGRQGDDLFCLVFRTCGHTEARKRALDIAKDLGTRLVGDKVVGFDRPLALAAEVHLAGAANEDGTLNPRILAQAVNEMRAIVAINAPSTGNDQLRSWMRPSPPPPPAEPQPLRAHMRPSSPRPPAPIAGKAAKAARKPPACLSGMIEGDSRPRDDDFRWTTLERPRGGSDDWWDQARPLPADTRLSLLWRPTWTDDEVIGAYRANVQRVDKPDDPALEGSAAYVGGENTAEALDQFVIGRAMRDFLATEKAGLGSVVVLPVHWASLFSPQRATLMAPLADATREARAARLVMELFGIPPGIDEGTLTTAVTALRRICREVIVRTSLADPRAEACARAGASCIAADLSDLTATERSDDDDQLLARLVEFQSKAIASGLGACVWGVRRRRVISGAVLGGFAMVNGPALMKDIARPAKVLPAPLERFATTF